MPSARRAPDTRQCAQLTHAPDGEAIAAFDRWQAVLADGGDGHLVAARGQFQRKTTGLALDAADERRIVVAGQQDAHGRRR